MNEALFNLGFDEVGWTSSKNMLKAEKNKNKNQIIEKERDIRKLIYSIKPKIK